MNSCEITVVICVFNKALYLERCINSVLGQTAPPDKIICVNDCSSDGSDKILEKYSNNYPGLFTIIHNKLNLGLTGSRNIALQYVKTPYVAFLDADDYWDPTKLQKQSIILSTGADLVYNAYRWVHSDKIDQSRFCLAPSLSGCATTETLLEGNFISGSASSVVCKYENLSKVGYSDHNLKVIANDFGEDWDMWLRLSCISNFRFSTEVLTYLDDSGSYSGGSTDIKTTVRWFKAHFYIRAKHFYTYRIAATKWQFAEYSEIVKKQNDMELSNLKEWMLTCHPDFAREIFKLYADTYVCS